MIKMSIATREKNPNFCYIFPNTVYLLFPCVIAVRRPRYSCAPDAYTMIVNCDEYVDSDIYRGTIGPRTETDPRDRAQYSRDSSVSSRASTR